MVMDCPTIAGSAFNEVRHSRSLTINETHLEKYVRCTNEGGCVITVPDAGGFAAGTLDAGSGMEIHFRGTGPLTFVAGATFVIINGVDGFEHVAVIGDRVRVRRSASTDAEEIAFVSFAVLRRGRDDQAPEAWTPVIAPDGRAGYISSQYVRSPIDYRAFFTKKDGRWRMVMLLAGD